MSDHKGHTVVATVEQVTHCSMEWHDDEGWRPNWQSEVVESVDVDESTLFCKTCDQLFEVK